MKCQAIVIIPFHYFPHEVARLPPALDRAIGGSDVAASFLGHDGSFRWGGWRGDWRGRGASGGLPGRFGNARGRARNVRGPGEVGRPVVGQPLHDARGAANCHAPFRQFLEKPCVLRCISSERPQRNRAVAAVDVRERKKGVCIHAPILRKYTHSARQRCAAHGDVYICRVLAEDFASIVKGQLAAKRWNAHHAARINGLPRDSIKQVLRGHIPRLDRVIEICAALGLHCRIGPPSESRPRDSAPSLLEPTRISGSIVAYPVEAAEIRGAASPSGCMLFTATFLRTFNLDAAHLLAIEIQDDDMAPLLITGGCAVADRRRRALQTGGIYALESDGPPLLRRAAKNDSGAWMMRRDLPDLPDEPWPVGLKALGRVVWASRMDFTLDCS